MDKYRREVERLKEREKIYKGEEDGKIIRRRKLISNHLKIALFIVGLFIVGFIFKNLYAVVGAVLLAAGVYLFTNFYNFFYDDTLQDPYYSDLDGNIYNTDDDD